MTQGQGTFTMEFARYRPVPMSIQTEIIADRKRRIAAGVKCRLAYWLRSNISPVESPGLIFAR